MAIVSHLFTSTRILHAKDMGSVGEWDLVSSYEDARESWWRGADVCDIRYLDSWDDRQESAAPHNLPSLKLVNLYTFKQVRSAFMPDFEKNDRVLIIVLYICVQYIILLNRHATFHRINPGTVQCVYCQLLQLSKLPLHMFIFQTNLFRGTWPLLNGQLNFWWDKH